MKRLNLFNLIFWIGTLLLYLIQLSAHFISDSFLFDVGKNDIFLGFIIMFALMAISFYSDIKGRKKLSCFASLLMIAYSVMLIKDYAFSFFYFTESYWLDRFSFLIFNVGFFVLYLIRLIWLFVTEPKKKKENDGEEESASDSETKES